jgi:hypothetical protein
MTDPQVKRMIQVGVVSSVDMIKLTARVIFRESGMVSAELPVIQRDGVLTTDDGSHSHSVSEGSCSPAGQHHHKTQTWMPKINDVVLVVYPCVQNSDGFILGRIPT